MGSEFIIRLPISPV